MHHKVAIITGGSRGIGKGIADYLVEQGYHLLLLAMDATRLQATAEELAARYQRPLQDIQTAAVDISQYAPLQTIIKSFLAEKRHIDLLVNNAGYVKRGSSDLSPEEFQKMLNVNLLGTFYLVHLVTPWMKKAQQGRIINIASHSGKVAKKRLAGYAASKFGVMGLNEGLYKELAEYNISVTAICPNLVATDMTSDVDMALADMLEVDDVVKTIDYLLALSPAVAVKEIVLQCRKKVLEEN